MMNLPSFTREESGQDVFLPDVSLEGRSNFRRHLFIERDGSTTARVYLSILDKRHREVVVLTHFLQFCVRHLIKEVVGIKFLSRDDPWDFKLELSSGVCFNIEIVSVADHDQQHRKTSNEDLFAKNTQLETVPLRVLSKLVEAFPDVENKALVNEYKRRGVLGNEMVANPYFGTEQVIFTGSHYPRTQSIGSLIDEAITSKESKAHGEKECTVLIVDNRTSLYFVSELTDALDGLQPRIDKSPFEEIWFYNGYCSDNDGNNGAYTFVSLKQPGALTSPPLSSQPQP
jgi:hypothetical protein